MPLNLKRNGVVTAQIREDKVPMITRAKRKSNEVIGIQGPSKKRAAFGDITNAFTSKNILGQPKKGLVKKPPVKSSIPIKAVSKVKENVTKDHRVPPVETEKAVTTILPETLPSTSAKDTEFVESMNKKNLVSSPSVEIKDAVAAISLESDEVEEERVISEEETEEIEEYTDIDAENLGDPNLAPNYAADIFKYLKEKEESSQIDDYFSRQKDITRHMRSVLVDWLVEVQENFELNHETLYLAVKLTDMYLAKCKIAKDLLQLLGAASLFIACKFDERIPPALDDFLYICDDAYSRTQFTDMERKVLRVVNFSLGVPLSYRFLRRYAKCAHATLETLTLARFILELSLMESTFITMADSLIASSALLLAFRMKSNGTWDATLRHYSGYKEEDLKQCMYQLNSMLNREPNKQLATVRNKYSHPLFYEVAKIPCIDPLEL
ncbi:G2/mitotic-specific cyclin-B3-like [Lytechinus pictus]|uniref:G2/mitotic-specific cyclin-B3-like n=1 Tax=Lytechinus pictus TaxID=7653 RepID=UPI00240DEFDE|nr:LOW QUALITY PROTEIN: G2/mitotic-specific cyclin-B3-like [Lytechinus pictus]XP_054771672.1 LOW QUALITY PROTEIN: G2/mitotic-specific cyclin-B3-like [Lytechinus pictus]